LWPPAAADCEREVEREIDADGEGLLDRAAPGYALISMDGLEILGPTSDRPSAPFGMFLLIELPGATGEEPNRRDKANSM
jgi:hypothetical protein